MVLHCIVIIQGKTHKGVCGIFFFGGEINVQNYGAILSVRHTCINVERVTQHVVSILLSEIFHNIPVFKTLEKFSKRLRNVFFFTRHDNTTMFSKYTKNSNRGIKVVLIKPSDLNYIYIYHHFI